MERPQLERAHFVMAAHERKQLPADSGVEIAFAGRSNAGKSSALNKLVGRRNLARTSRTPGRTQQMVVFELAESVRLVDLPGYGYAKVPAALRQHWQREIDAYLRFRKSLCGVVLVSDIRHELKPFDRQMIDFSQAVGLRCHVLLTKADKLSRNQAAKSLADARKLAGQDGSGTTFQIFSSLDGQGVEAAREHIIGMLTPEDASDSD